MSNRYGLLFSQRWVSAPHTAGCLAPFSRANSYRSQALEGKNVKDLLLNVGSGGGAAAAPTGGAAGGAAADAPAEEKQEEKKEEGKLHHQIPSFKEC